MKRVLIFLSLLVLVGMLTACGSNLLVYQRGEQAEARPKNITPRKIEAQKQIPGTQASKNVWEDDVSSDLPPAPDYDQAAEEGGLVSSLSAGLWRGAAPSKVAILAPLSGRGQKVGKSLVDAAQLAFFEIGNSDLSLMPYDTKGTADGARAAANKAVADGAQMVLGPLFSESVNAAKSVLRSADVPMIAFTNDHAVAGRGVYIMGLLPQAEVARVIAFAVANGSKNIAALVPDNEYGKRVRDALKEVLWMVDASIVGVHVYNPDDLNDIQAVVDQMVPAALRTKIEEEAKKKRENRHKTRDQIAEEEKQEKEERTAMLMAMSESERNAFLEKEQEGLEIGFDTILLADGGDRLRYMAPLLSYYNIDSAHVRMLGTALWEDSKPTKEHALHRGWFAAPEPQLRRRFEKRFRDVYGYGAPRIASLSYDAASLSIALAREGAFSSQLIEQVNGYQGLDGIFRFRSDGIPERGLAVMEVLSNGVRVISKSPRTFQESLY